MWKKIILACSLVCLCVACSDDVGSPIPSAQVNLTLDLIGRDNNLNGSLAYSEYIRYPSGTYNYKNPLESDRLGYGGVLVINAIGVGAVNLCALDLSCPNEAVSGTRVAPDKEGLMATCPKCGAVYKISDGSGYPQSGSEHKLKGYAVVQVSETRYKVQN